VVSEVLALRMNEEVAGQLHTNMINLQDVQAARIWELEKQVDGMGLMIQELWKKQESTASLLEECQHQSVMCQALLTHYVESHWVPIGLLLEQIGGRSTCGLFPPQPHYSLGARVPRNEWEDLRNISRSGSILLHCNQQIHLWHI